VRGFGVAVGLGDGFVVGVVDGVGVADGDAVGDAVGDGLGDGVTVSVGSTSGVTPVDAVVEGTVEVVVDGVVEGMAAAAVDGSAPELHGPWIDPQPASSTATTAPMAVAARVLLVRPIGPAPSRAPVAATGSTRERDAGRVRQSTRRS
jgi:hypothetical protein